MAFFKKHSLRISLLLILLAAAFLCIFTIGNYHSNSVQTPGRIGSNNSLPGERSRFSDIQNEMPKGQFPDLNLSILAFIYLRDKRLLLLSAGFSSTVYINTHLVLFQTSKGLNSVSFSPILIFTSLLNVLLFIYLAKVLFDIAIRKRTYTYNAK